MERQTSLAMVATRHLTCSMSASSRSFLNPPSDPSEDVEGRDDLRNFQKNSSCDPKVLAIISQKLNQRGLFRVSSLAN
jgi:hypothetical protein